MISVLLRCDADDCERYFVVAAIIGPSADADEVLAIAHRSYHRGEPAVQVVGNVVLPHDWTAGNDAEGCTRVYCADHAGRDPEGPADGPAGSMR